FEDGQLSGRYLWAMGVDQLLADESVTNNFSAGDIRWTLTDHLGSVRDLASTDGTIVDHALYDAFGNTIDNPNDGIEAAIDSLIGYTGRPFDEQSGFQNNHHRWYDAEIARWLSQDPIEFEAGDPNLYRYTGNQPTTKVDPNGLSWIVKLKVVVTETGEMVFSNGKKLKLRNFEFANKNAGLDDILNIKRSAKQQAKMEAKIDRIRKQKGDDFKVHYDEYAQPDFSHCAERSFRVPNMTGNAAKDNAKAWQQLKKDLPADEFNDLDKRRASLRLHHTNDGRILIVDKDIHDAFSHTGPASMMRASGQYSGMAFAIFAPSTGKLVNKNSKSTVWEYSLAAGTDIARFLDPCVEEAYQVNRWTSEISDRVTTEVNRSLMLRNVHGGGSGRILLDSEGFPISPRLRGSISGNKK
ncbi:MAG: RHS repeat-associated core domain-containing protein, partial [Pirellulales bacterium]|nr:RHS repeat-associated core domain-containing protein [Pirellulales bacterium]